MTKLIKKYIKLTLGEYKKIFKHREKDYIIIKRTVMSHNFKKMRYERDKTRIAVKCKNCGMWTTFGVEFVQISPDILLDSIKKDMQCKERIIKGIIE